MDSFVAVQIKTAVSNFIVSFYFFLTELPDAFKWRPCLNTLAILHPIF